MGKRADGQTGAEQLVAGTMFKALESHLCQRLGGGPGQEVYARFLTELDRLLLLHAEDSAAERRHTWRNILPSIALYEALSAGMDKTEALEETRCFITKGVEKGAQTLRQILRLPLLHRALPYWTGRIVRKYFNAAAGFEIQYLQRRHGCLRYDVINCPYMDTCARHGCRELVPVFCAMDDVLLAELHSQIRWCRNETIGCGGSLCDFEISLRDRPFKASKGTP